MTDLKQIKTDETRAREGIWVTYPGTDIRLRIASFSTAEYQSAARKALKPYRSRRRMDNLEPRELKDRIADAVAEYIWLGFENITEEGVPVSDTVRERARLLKLHSLDDLYDFILETAGDADEYRQRIMEEDAGN